MQSVKLKRNNGHNKVRTGSGSFFAPAPVQTKLSVNSPGDTHEREADRIAEQVTSAPLKAGNNRAGPVSVTPVHSGIQREEKKEPEKDVSTDVLTEGASVAYEQLKNQPGYEAWEEKQTEKLKLRLWDSQPADAKAGIIGFGLTNLGLLGTAFALDPSFRSKSIDLLEDQNIALPLRLLPYSEFYGLSSFKYKLPTAQYAPYTFSTEFEFDAWLEIMRKKWNIPKTALTVGIESEYSKKGGFRPVTGGMIKLKLGGGIVHFSAFYNKALPPSPQLISNPVAGEPPIWLMRSLPGQLEENLPKGSGVFLTVDILRLPELIHPRQTGTKTHVQRKEKSSSAAESTAAPAMVQDVATRSSGKPLDKNTRSEMESRLGQDLSHVRIHTDSTAARSARSIDARAYTSGSNIAFDHGEYQPTTARGKKLLAHELIHIGQQTGVVQRKKTTTTPVKDDLRNKLEDDLRKMLEEGRYASAYLALNDHFGWGENGNIKNWLLNHPTIRFLFLQHLPGDMIAGVHSADELAVMPRLKGFRIIDRWYPHEKDKQALYAVNRQLFDHFLAVISPYTGKSIWSTVNALTRTINEKNAYTSDFSNPEFHIINLLAPTVERKIKFYNTFSNLFKAVRKKFDPYTGLTKTTMANLTDTDEVDREKALEIYHLLKRLPGEQRKAFFETALFAGTVETDKDAQKYYKRNYRKQYKALPHNWDFAFWPWNWGEAPFADRMTVDHVAAMSQALNYEDKATRSFGFDRGIDSSKGRTIADPTGKAISDTERLIIQLEDDHNFNSPQRLAILLAIGVRGGLAYQITTRILRPRSKAGTISTAVLPVIESYGFIADDNFSYHRDKATAVDHDDSIGWYIATRTLFKWESGSVFGEQRGTFDLRRMQKTSALLGSLGGLKFGSTQYVGDSYYNSRWLDDVVKNHPGSSTLLANLKETKGEDRRGKIFASHRSDIRQANIYASTLPIDGLNFFSEGTLIRSGPGVIQGLQVHLSYTKEPGDPDNRITLRVDIGNLLINQFQLVDTKSTLAIGRIGVKGFRVRLSQDKSAKGFTFGLFKSADLTMSSLIESLPNVLKLLPYAVMTMTEEFKGVKEHTYKDAFGEIVKNDFSALDASVTFTSLQVRNMYDTAAGFLDDVEIQQKFKSGKRVRQGFRIKETLSWTVGAAFDIKGRLRTLDQKILEAKAELVGSDAATRIKKLEAEKSRLLNRAAEKGVRHESRDEEMNRLRTVMSEIRTLTTQLETAFESAKKDNPVYNPLPFQVIEAEKKRLQKDLDYLENEYYQDKKRAKGRGGAKRFEARRRMEAFEAKYKSFDVRMALRGLTLHGGNYVRDLVNDSLQSLGFVSPKLEGIENIRIKSIDSSFVASGAGASKKGEDKGIAIRKLHIPLITAPALAFKTSSMLLEAGRPSLQNTYVSVTLDFAENPLDRDPNSSYKYALSNLYIRKATFNGLTVKTGEAEPLLDFPADVPVEVWGMRLWDYDPEKGNINLRIRDIKAQGVYTDLDEGKQTGKKVSFGLDTTTDNTTKEGRKAAFDLRYNTQDESITTKVNIPSAWVPTIDIQTDNFSIQSLKDSNAVELTNLTADLTVLLARESTDNSPARPTTIEIRSLHLGEIAAQGITVTMFEEVAKKEDTPKQKSGRKIQEVRLPKSDTVSIKDIEVSGLRVTLADEGTTLSTLDADAILALGKSDLGGVKYTEKNARGSVLKAVALHTGKFDALTLKALGRNGREYSLNEFFKFFGYTRLEGLVASGSYNEGKTGGSIAVRGKKNQAISMDFVEPGEDKPGYYKIRLPLARINVPALHLKKEGYDIKIPKPVSRRKTSFLRDVDVKLRAYVEPHENDTTTYDVYLDSLDIAEVSVFGLEYHNTDKGIDVVFDASKPLHIPNVKAGGFRFSSSKAFDVFGKAGGWIEAAKGEKELISASFEKIQAALENGSFLAEKDASTGRSALDIDIASLGFRYDKEGNMFISLGAIKGGFPTMTISKTDPASGTKSTTTVTSLDSESIQAVGAEVKIGADQNTEIDVTGIEAGGLKVVHTETTGKETSTSTVKLGKKAVGAASTKVNLKADKSKEIIITDIRAGKINVDLVSTGAKGKSEKYITLPDPDLIKVESIKVLIDPDGNKRITIQKPTLKDFKLRIPSQDKVGDYISISCDLSIDGDVDLGDGNFSTLKFEDPRNAFVVNIESGVPAKISYLRLEYKNTTQDKASKEAPPKPLTPDQLHLLALEDTRDKAVKKLATTPPFIHYGHDFIDNPEYSKAKAAYEKAQKAYNTQKSKMIGAAKAEARASMTKKYLDAVQGDAKAKIIAFNSIIPVNIETHTDGEKYIEISKDVIDTFKSLIESILYTTADKPFWSSKEMKAIGEGLKRWYTWATPYTRGLINAIADGKALGAVLVFLEKTDMSAGTLRDDSTMFGLNFNINTSYGLDISGYDKFSVGLCEKKYQHPNKPNFYNLYGFIEYLQYVSPALVSKSGREDAKRMERLKKGARLTESEVSELGIGEAVKELIAFVKFSLEQEADNLKRTIIRNIHGVSFTADVSLRPQEVITELLKEKQKGTLTFDKGKKSIDKVHAEGAYVDSEAAAKIGGGKKGTDNINIPGATYLSQDKGTKVSYDLLQISPVIITHKNDILKVVNKNISLHGLRVGILKK